MLYLASLHQCYAVLQCQSYYQFSALPTVKWSFWEVWADCEMLVLKAKEEGKDFYNCLMIYCNTHLTGIMKSPMQILQARNAISDVPMSNAARKQLVIQPEVVMSIDKHAVLPIHDLHVGQDVMYQDSTSCLSSCHSKFVFEPRSYKNHTRDGIVYRKPQSHLKPFILRTRTLNLLSVCHPQWHNLPICGQWDKLSARSLLQWTIMYKYRQADLKGISSPQSSLIF